MSYSDILGENLIMNVRAEMARTTSKDTINKLYRQARIWVRFQWVYACGIDESESLALNNQLKHLRWKRLEELGYRKEGE